MADRPASLLSMFHRLATIGMFVLCVCTTASPIFGDDLRRTPVVEAVQSARPSVVNIHGEKTVPLIPDKIGQADSGKRVNGMGTGIVIDADGYIITNYHVVEGVREIRTTLANGQEYMAKLVNRDPSTDLAIIKIDPLKPLPVISVGMSSDLMPGEPVVAVGNAYGYEHTVTRGIISALHRPVQVSDAQFYEDLIQTDASINPGNSGGPLLNIHGDMIGINVAVRAGAQGIGFAIPVDKAVEIAGKLLATHSMEKGWHGVEVATNPSGTEGGLVVTSVAAKGPGEKAGLKPGDTILRAGDLATMRALDFHRAVLSCTRGKPMNLSVRRGLETLAMSIRLVEQQPSQPIASKSQHWELLGLNLEPIDREAFHETFHTRYRGGLAVSAVRSGSQAAKQGIRQGDVLVGMHIWETISLDNVDYVCNRTDLGTLNPVKVFVLRGNETRYGYLSIPVKLASTASKR